MEIKNIQKQEIFEKLRGHKPSFIGMDRCKQAAVCIPIVTNPKGDPGILFEVRAAKIAHQPGDICLPGGMIEPGETPRQAAIRELCEELLVSEEQVSWICDTDRLFTGSSMILYSCAVEVKDYAGTFSPAEVAETFCAPLSFFLEQEPECYQVEAQIRPGEDFPFEKICGGRDYHWRKRREDIYFYEYEGYVIWGLTAKLIRAFVEIL